MSLVVLLGFSALAVDYGRMVATKNQLQRACDAGALAAAIELPATDSTRTARAIYYAQLTAFQNGVKAAETMIAFPSATEINVMATRQVKYLFAPVLGLSSGTVRATALAGRTNLAGIPHCVPLAITINDYNTYRDGTAFDVRLTRNNKEDFAPGGVVALDLRPGNQGKSGAVFEQDLTYGWNDPITFGDDDVNTLNASLTSQRKKLEDGINSRISRAAGAPWYDNGTNYTFPEYSQGNPRVITIIVADPNDTDNSNPHINPLKFASVYVEQIRESGGDTYLRFRILPKQDFNADDPNIIIGNEHTPGIGFSVVRLRG